MQAPDPCPPQSSFAHFLHVRVAKFVCVRERERLCVRVCAERESVCVYVVKERERKRENERNGKRERARERERERESKGGRG